MAPEDVAGADAAHGRGRRADVVEVAVPGRSWTELAASHPALRAAAAGGAQPVVRVPLGMAGATPAATAAGRHDAQWRGLGAALAAGGRTAVVRLTVPDDPDVAQTRAAFRRASAAIRSGGRGVLVEWTAPFGVDPATLDEAWPGADSIDVVGVQAPASGRWADVVAGTGGLVDWSDFAAAQGKRIAVHWRIGAATDPSWVRNMSAWIELTATQRRLAYETVSVAQTSDEQALAAYRSLW